VDLPSDELVAWIVAQGLPFDSLYFYGVERPIHISYGPQHKRDVWAFTEQGTPTRYGMGSEEKRNHWGSQKLAALRQKMKAKKVSPGQKSLWENWTLPTDEIVAVAKKFVLANCFNPDVAVLQFTDTT
jgi:hypothetical protein